MCGRYTVRKPPKEYEEHFGVEFPETDRYNVAPSQEVPVIRDRLSMMKWGLVPSWSKEPKAGFSNINARRDTVAKTNAFRSAFKHRRCQMPADGFYEFIWTNTTRRLVRQTGGRLGPGRAVACAIRGDAA
jgi:putative SOS response-associated peptidase YedK